MDSKKKKDYNEKNFIVMILILIALIVIIFLLVRNLGFIDHNPRIPTGNVDIFDIIFNKDCKNNCYFQNSCNGNNTSGSNGAENGGSNNDNQDNSTNPTLSNDKDGVEVFDEETEYSKDTPLNIFTQTSYYVVDHKIAPLSENSYQFIIRNNNEFNIKYDLELFEENKYNINMKYRLKLNGVYVAGSNSDWITYNKLKQIDIGLSANNYDVYTLDWKWFESDNDTEVGTNINSNYKLDLKITASGY